MSKKSRRKRQKINLDFDDDSNEFFDNDFDLDELSRDIYSTEWGDSEDYYNDKGFKVDSRRRIERRKDTKKLYSELNEWEEFGARGDW